ncbi:RNA polymerase sigma factor [Luteimonas sp. 3794]|uniref:RNA polymerase sigma factor n=1 Tax=Luteimonas sp. 3794 TaxID=2817730 RepID=UPI002855E859|nr:RNA polymerase sigma factor [Luteimonas sp. 3794]MDR6991597.1 RNA polymerase sigma-70 factor (ECF subfamily) [Luteimonas sp. 3794]
MPPSWSQVQALHPQLWRAVCGYELNPALRDELMQDVLLAVWQALPKLRAHDRLLPFALRVAHNLGASHVRSAIRTPAPLPLDPDTHDVPDPNSVADAERARSEWLFEALTTLPLTLRQPLMLQLEGFDYGEIAELLGISMENVGVRLHRARHQLKTLQAREETTS